MKKTRSDNNISSKILRRLPFLLMLPFGLLLPHIAARYPWFVESYYSRGIYPYISGTLGRISSIFGFSIAEIAIYVFLLTLSGLIIVHIFRLVSRRIPLLEFLSFVLSLCITAGALLCGFYLCWGFNYSRPTLYQLMGLEVKSRSAGELFDLCEELAIQANSLCTQVPRDESGIFSIGDTAPYFAGITQAYTSAGSQYPLFSQRVYPAKYVLSSEGMSWAGISGIYIPYTAEANVNTHQPALLMLSSAAHENAHFLGFAKEDEANFISYLVCSQSSDPAIAYSGTMLALIHCGNKLYQNDPDGYGEIYTLYSENMLRDIADYNRYWQQYEGKVEEAFDAANDNYLKFNNQQDGVKSYGMMVDLMLAYREKHGTLLY